MDMDTLKELERILLIYKYLANTYEIIARDYCEICSVPMSNTFCNTMNSIISSFNKLIIFFKQMCHEQYKLSDYAIEQCDVNEKFLLNLLKLIEEIFYFDVSGNSFSIPNGLQEYYAGKNYQIMIRTYLPSIKKYRNTTYTFSMVIPTGTMPVVILS